MARSQAAWIALLLIGVIAVLVPLTDGGTPARTGPPERPNVLIIMTDDQRADRADLKVMPKTRAIFKESGTSYRNAVATTPLCCPSRASIYSGKYTHNHGVTSNPTSGRFDADESLQALLQDGEYRTAYVGKYLSVGHNPPYFDLWATMAGGKLYSDFDINVNGTFKPVKGYITDFLTTKAIGFLDKFENNDSDPWFLIVAPNAPHLPAKAKSKYADSDVPRWRWNPARREGTPRELRDKPDYVHVMQKPIKKAKRFRRSRLLSLKSVDDMVARIFKRLASHEEGRDTLAFFLSDNGFMLGEHHVISKRFPYDQSLRIPLFVRWPGQVPEGEVRRKIVGNIDLAPTIYDATGITPDYEVDGKSLFRSKRTEILVESWRDRGSPEIPPYSGIWTPGYKYIEYGTGEKEFYRADDKWELVNRLGNKRKSDDPPNQPQLSTLLDLYKSCVGATCP